MSFIEDEKKIICYAIIFTTAIDFSFNILISV